MYTHITITQIKAKNPPITPEDSVQTLFRRDKRALYVVIAVLTSH